VVKREGRSRIDGNNLPVNTPWSVIKAAMSWRLRVLSKSRARPSSANVTQPVLTNGVQKLEQKLGGQLIYRERQPTQLTDLGKEVPRMLERTLASAQSHVCL